MAAHVWHVSIRALARRTRCLGCDDASSSGINECVGNQEWIATHRDDISIREIRRIAISNDMRHSLRLYLLLKQKRGFDQWVPQPLCESIIADTDLLINLKRYLDLADRSVVCKPLPELRTPPANMV